MKQAKKKDSRKNVTNKDQNEFVKISIRCKKKKKCCKIFQSSFPFEQQNVSWKNVVIPWEGRNDAMLSVNE